MKFDELMAMKPGRELNQMVHEIVFGNDLTGFQFHHDSNIMYRDLDDIIRDIIDIPEYSTTWEGMRLVVEEMQRRGFSVFLNNHSSEFRWNCNFRNEQGEIVGGAFSDSAPHAVILAALAAIKAIQGEDALA